MRVGVVVPAYNEGPRLGKVLEVLVTLPWLDKIAVVNDGSLDDTGKVARRYPVLAIDHSANLGKGAALQTGLAHLRHMDAVLFLDADLVGLTEQHLQALLQPLATGQAPQMVVGTFRHGRWHVDIQQKYFAILNGQRALSRRLLDSLPDLSWSRYGVEVLLSSFAAHQSYPVAEAFLHGLTHVIKEEKFGLIRGFYLRLQMYLEVLRARHACRRLFPAGKAPGAEPHEQINSLS